MDEQLARAVGARVRSARAANRQAKVVVAGLAGITTDYLYQIERGRKLPAIPVLVQLASALRVPVASLIPDGDGSLEPRVPVRDTGIALYSALTRPRAPREQPPLAELRERVQDAWRLWQTSPQRYSRLGDALPVLVSDLEAARGSYRKVGDPSEWRRAQGYAVDLYGLLRTVAKRIGRVDLSLLAADRAIQAAEAADDPLRLAVARWNLAHVLLIDGEFEGAEAARLR